MDTHPRDHNQPPPLADILAENFAGFATEIEAIVAKATAAPKKVKDPADLDYIGVVVKDARAMMKRVDTARTDQKAPHLEAGRTVDTFFKTMTERLAKVAEVLTERASQYQREQIAIERKRQEDEARKARELAEKERQKQAEAEAAGKANAAAKAEVKAEIAEDRAQAAERAADQSNADLARQRTASGATAGARTTKKVRIVSMAEAVPGPLGPYIDRDAVQKAANKWLGVTKGEEKLPGLEVFDDVQATFR